MKSVFAIITSLLVLLLLSFASQKAEAAISCQPVYGGGQTCIKIGNVVVNKTVQNPQTGAYVENLSSNDPTYAPLQVVNFQITASNIGEAVLSKTTIKDTFPQFVSFLSGPGNFDLNTNTLSFDILTLNPGESRTFTISGQIAGTNQFPTTQGAQCLVNKATVTATTDTGEQTGQDSAQFCVQNQAAITPTVTTTQPTQPGQPITLLSRQLVQSKSPTVISLNPTVTPTPEIGGRGGGRLIVQPPVAVKTSPATGPETGILFGLIPTGALGYFIRKKSTFK